MATVFQAWSGTRIRWPATRCLRLKKPGHRCTLAPRCNHVAGRTATTKSPNRNRRDRSSTLIGRARRSRGQTTAPSPCRLRLRRRCSDCNRPPVASQSLLSTCAVSSSPHGGPRISSDFRGWSEVLRQGRAPPAFLYAAWYPVRRTARDPKPTSAGGLTHPYSVIRSVEAELEHSPRLVAWPILFPGLAFESGRGPSPSVR